MTKSKKNILIISVSLLLIAVIAMAIAFGVILPQQAVYISKVKDEMPNMSNDVNNSVMDLTPNEEYGIALAAAAGPSPFTKTLTATIQPGDAPNKAVDWSVAWQEGDPKASETVTNYVIVTPASDGALTATVKCIKAFTGSKIVVTVKTRVGGFKATCVADYVGYAQTIKISTEGKTVKQDNSWGQSIVELTSNTVNNFAISFDNDLHAVGNYAKKYSIKVETFGSIITDTVKYNFGSSVESGTKGTGEETWGAQTGDSTSTNVYLGHINAGCKIFTVSCEGNQLVVTTENAMSSYRYTASGRSGSSGYNLLSTFKGYKDNKIPYIKITITETTTSISTSINVMSISAITGVSMSEATMTF